MGEQASAAMRAFGLRAVPAFAIAAAFLALFPFGGDGSAPTMRVLLLSGLVVGAVMLTALWLALRLDLRLPTQIAVFVVTFNLLVLVVKMVLAPHAVYLTNRIRPFESLAPIDTTSGAVGVASVVFVLYTLALGSLFLLSRRRLRTRLQSWSRRPGRGWFVVATLVSLVMMSVVVSGGAVLLLAYLAGEPGLEYLSFLLASGMSALIAALLAGALLCASVAFRQTEDRAGSLGDAAVLSSLFWVCLAFLALYHVLWVIYLLVLTSVWPLRVVVPK